MIAVIVPIYNTEKYLRETIDSVICQTLSFAEHIRLIVLDDASTDGSFAICEQYQKQYPKQILVKHYDTNQGVSALRNEGVRIAGEMGDELITFLASDDKLADDAMEKAKKLNVGEILLLENIRFLKGEENNDPELALKLASMADAVSYTHSPSPRDRTRSRMPSSA